MASWNSDNTGLDNGLLSDGTKPLPEPMLNYNLENFVALTQEQFKMKHSR